MSLAPVSEEEFCHQQLARLREDYERAAKPWIDRLVLIERCKRPEYLVMLASTAPLVARRPAPPVAPSLPA